MLTGSRLKEIARQLKARGFGSDVEWSENCGPPKDPEDFASEAIFVICNSGMKNTVARRIYDKVMGALRAGADPIGVFGHAGKVAAIAKVWAGRDDYFALFMGAGNDAERLAACACVPWIGPITKYHLSKNFGVQVAKPDVHLQRLADAEHTTPQALCERLAAETAYRVATVDLLLWRACAEGLLNSRTYDPVTQEGDPNFDGAEAFEAHLERDQ